MGTTSDLEPLDPEARALLETTEPREPRIAEATRERMRLRLEMALASADGSPVRPRPAPWGRRAASLAAAAALGAAGALLLSRTTASRYDAPSSVGALPRVEPSAPPAPLPSGTQVVSPTEPTASLQSSIPASSSSARPPSRDEGLSAEGHLIEKARAALVHGDFAAALSATEQHARSFPRGRLAEEREAIAVQALAGLGRAAEARARADAFRGRYPQSVFLPLVDAALGTNP